MAGSSFQVLALCVLTFFGGCLASRISPGYCYGQQQQGQPGIIQGECNLTNLNPLEPIIRFEYEAGSSEFWDENNQQLRCAGAAVTRHVIRKLGLLLPSLNNAPMIVFVIKGNGMLGVMYPGCPETYESFQQSEGQQGQFRDQHQKIHPLYRGDVVALPAGVAHWVHNHGNDDLVLVVVHDTSNLENQLDQNLRRFFLAGNPQQQQKQGSEPQQERYQGVNIFQVFDTQVLARAFNVDPETARKLQNEKDGRGRIVKAQGDFRALIPRKQQVEEGSGHMNSEENGLEETICTRRLRENLANPERADIYTARGGTISSVNSLNLPILKSLQLSAGRGFLHPNAMVAPHWGINAHSISYIAEGSVKVQVVGHSKRAVFDGEVKEGQLLIIPQNFAHFKQAGNKGCEWYTVKTNDLAKSSPLAGKTSVIRALPLEVLMNAFKFTREEARRIKYSREEVTIFRPPQSDHQYSESEQTSIPMSIV